MLKVKSCGIILFDSDKFGKFLLLRQSKRWDLPKGLIKPCESELECALREFREETGIKPKHVELMPGFRFSISYIPDSKKYCNKLVHKELVLFLAYLKKMKPVRVTEHIGYEWMEWNPPHDIQVKSINPAIQSVADYFERMGINKRELKYA